VTGAPAVARIRPATPADYPHLGDVWLSAWYATFDFPPAHPDDDVRRWLASEMAPNHDVWVGVDADDRVIGFMAVKDTELDQLYIEPAWIGHGLGRRFVDLAKAHSPTLVELYCFQVNDRARRFYERNGFRAVAFGDGASNEERQPDIRYAWRPEA
jgi:RimJ/RimL family protein N-acetyltransferase